MTEIFNPSDPALYRFWKQALENKKAGIAISVPVDQPQAGYYSATHQGDLVPVAFWWKERGVLKCKLDRDMMAADQGAMLLWNRCGDAPVTQEAYKTRTETGKWPETPDFVRGRNEPASQLDTLGKIAEIVTEAGGFLRKHAKIEAQADADKAQAFVAALRSLRGKATDEHKAEKAPHLAAGREVDLKFKPAIDQATLTIEAVLAAITVFLKAQDTKASALAAQTGLDVAKPAAGRGQVIGGKKRATTLKEFTVVEIKDPKLLAVHYCNHPKMLELMNALARAEYEASNNAPPGTEITKEKRAI